MVTFTPPNQPTFLSGTGVKLDSGDQLGLDASVVVQEPGVELIGIIDDGARVIGVQDDVFVLRASKQCAIDRCNRLGQLGLPD